MLTKKFKRASAKIARKLSLRTVLIVPFVLQISATVGLVGYLSFKNGEQAINEIANQLTNQVSERIEQHISSFLEIAPTINQINLQTIQNGLLNVNNTDETERYLWNQLSAIPRLSAIAFTNPNGEIISANRYADGTLSITVPVRQNNQLIHLTYQLNEQGSRTKLIPGLPLNYDVQNQDWYRDTIKTKQANWSQIYFSLIHQEFSIASVKPVYNDQGEFQGLFSTNFSRISQINQFLTSIKIGKTGKTVIVEPSGIIIASSDLNSLSAPGITEKPERLQIENSPNPLFKTAVAYLKQEFGSLDNIKTTQQLRLSFEDKNYFLQVNPFEKYQGISWQIITIVPETDFMERIHINRQKTILLCIGAAFLSAITGAFVVRWVTQPIRRFNTAAKAIAKGEWNKIIKINRTDELGELSKSFNQMAAQLKTSFTDLKDLNTELISSKQQLNQFLEALPIGVAVINIDGEISYANEMAKHLVGKDINLSSKSENRAIIKQLYQSGTEQLYQEKNLPFVRALQGETVVVDDIEIRREGQIIPLEMRTVPVFNSQGKVAYAIAAFHDITDRKRIEAERRKAEKALRESEQRYADLAKAAPVGIFRNDLQGNCLYGNERSFAMIGVTEKEVFGAGWAKSLHPDDRDRVISAWYDFVQNGIPFNCEYRFQQSDGKIIWVFGQAVAEKDIDGNIVGYVGTITDISERKQAEKLIENYNRTLENQVAQRTAELAQTNARLEQEISDRKQAQTELEKAKEIAEAANRAKSSFLANMSHELRTPLNAILGFSQLMSHEENLSPEQQEKITIIRRSGEHLLSLINQVLDLSKIEAGRMTLIENEFDLYRLLNEVELMFSLKAQEKNLKLNLKYDGNVPQYICTDEVKLRQVLINLLNNAIKFTEEGSVIVKTSMQNANKILFAVIDTGVGISAEEIPNLFKPFVQTSSGKQIQEGTGLGLTISYQFVRLMGGEISVISDSKIFTPGTSIQNFEKTMGTTFQFSIPVQVTDGKYVYQKSLKCQNITIAPHEPSYRMLVVDDNDYNCQLLVNLLKSLGFELQVAKNGYEAIELWENFRPHLIWMDMRMPVMDGHQATQEIRLRESKITELSINSLHSPTVIIALTAGVLNGNKGAALISGCNGFVSKPFQEEDIFEILQTHLNLSFVCHNPIINHEPKLAAAPKLSPPSLINLPKELVANLNYAITIGDWEEMHLIVEQAKLHDENLANQLLTLLNEYKFQELLELTDQECS